MTTHDGLTWDEVIDKLDNKYVVVDVEHNPLIEKRIPGNGASLGVAIAGFEKGTQHIISHYYPFRHRDVNVTSATGDKLRAFLKSVNHLIYYNAKNDIVTAADLGIDTSGDFYDPQLMEHWINGKWHNMSLDTISRLHGGNPKDMSPEMYKIVHGRGKNKGWADVPYFMMRPYAANDAVIEFQLFLKLLPKFKKFEELWKIEQDFIRTLIKMERVGIKVNVKKCKEEIEFGNEVMEEIVAELGLNPSSRNDTYELFINQLKLPVLKRTPKGAPSFTKETLIKYDIELAKTDSPVAKMVRKFRGWQKTITANYESYLEHLGPDGRVRPNYNLHATFTGRLSANDPALQQIPRLSDQEWNGDVRNAFEAAVGYTVWDVDYSQLELRMIAHYAEDNELLAILNNPKRHLFKEMAANLSWPYNPTKTFVYSVSYGAGVDRIMEIFGVDPETAKRMRDQFFTQYASIGILLKKCMAAYKKNGFIKLWTGREIRNRLENKPYAALDYVAQGGGAEIVKRNMITLAETIDWLDCRMVLQVHDSVAFEIRNGTEDYWLPIIKKIMERPPHPHFMVKFPVAIKKWGTESEIEVA